MQSLDSVPAPVLSVAVATGIPRLRSWTLKAFVKSGASPARKRVARASEFKMAPDVIPFISGCDGMCAER
jgi:hypothetical protein